MPSSSSPAPLLFSAILFSFLVSLLFLLLLSSPPISAATSDNTSTSHRALPSTQHHKKCVHEHLSALLKLKRGFNLSQSITNLASWDANDTDCCSWEGVNCNPFTGHVIGLNLSRLLIAGVIDFESLFQLRSLQTLDLSFNGFDGSPIPSGLAQLSSLTHLNLGGCHLHGQIPLDISHLTRLVSLDLSYNDYGKAFNYEYLHLESSSMRELFRNLSSLRELYLDWVDMSAVGSQWSQILPYSLPNLRKLSMRRCGLSGAIPPSLSRLHFLTLLDLSYNHLSSPVPESISNLTSLTSLSLAECDLHHEFPENIFNLPKLRSIDISDNQFLTIYLPKVSTNSTIQELRMSRTQFHGNLADILGNFKSLTHLDLNSCNLLGPIPQSHVNLSQLAYLDLSSNNFQGPIPRFIFSLTGLTRLDLSSNNFGGALDLGSFQNLKNLVILDLSYNNLSAIINTRNSSASITSQPPVSLSQLAFLDLSGNNFQGPIPSLTFSLSELTHLQLSSNNFGGVMDLGSFQNLKNLAMLDLSHNNLSAIIDTRNSSTSTSFPQLSYLYLASCNISKFPDILRNQEKMVQLNLASNRISGKIPQWVWKVGNGELEYLNLSNNALEGFEGPFPRLSSSLMRFLDLSNNMLKGPILIPPPSSRFFSLANNTLDGEVPSLICDAASLEVLDLSNNHFTGMLPQCLGEISDALTVLDLHKNAFRGPLVQTFKAGCTIETLDLSDNQLEGRMPRSLANCKELTVLNLGNNQMKDGFPSELANLSNLRVLVLRSNKFFGSIGQPLESQEFFPMLQIIDLSFNNFSGSLPSNLFSAWKMMKDGGSASEFLAANISGAGLHYQNKVFLVNKGIGNEFVKILFAFTVVDLSHNQFDGDIPSSIGELKALHALNMSHNHFKGEIPASLGNLRDLESLDLSNNRLSGKIPLQLTKLSFLAVLNLSQNQLIGSIPQGRHFDTFQNDSFLGNPDLCGYPLSRKCEEDADSMPPGQSDDKRELDFMWIGFGVGHVVGIGIFFWTLALWRKGRRIFFMFIDRVLFSFLSCVKCSDM